MTTNKLKLTALILMLIDHIEFFIPDMPIWFRWAGRISAPIFFYCIAIGYSHTRDKKKYLLRLYLAGLVMGVLNLLLPYIYISTNSTVNNNIFISLFVGAVIIWLYELYLNDKALGHKYIIYFICIQLLSFGIYTLLSLVSSSSFICSLNNIIKLITANMFLCEGGVAFTILPIIFYVNLDKKNRTSIGYLLYCMAYIIIYVTDFTARIYMYLEKVLPELIYNTTLIIATLFDFNIIPSYSDRWYEFQYDQWLMVLALPIILMYNGEKGKGYKYFFYIFYPVHIYALFIIGQI